jgi:hypothetical protein
MAMKGTDAKRLRRRAIAITADVRSVSFDDAVQIITALLAKAEHHKRANRRRSDLLGEGGTRMVCVGEIR